MDIVGDVLAYLAVAARGRHREPPLFVPQADREAANLSSASPPAGLGCEAQIAAHAGVELRGGARDRVGLRANRQHGHRVPDRREIGSRRTADPPGG